MNKLTLVIYSSDSSDLQLPKLFNKIKNYILSLSLNVNRIEILLSKPNAFEEQVRIKNPIIDSLVDLLNSNYRCKENIYINLIENPINSLIREMNLISDPRNIICFFEDDSFDGYTDILKLHYFKNSLIVYNLNTCRELSIESIEYIREKNQKSSRLLNRIKQRIKLINFFYTFISILFLLYIISIIIYRLVPDIIYLFNLINWVNILIYSLIPVMTIFVSQIHQLLYNTKMILIDKIVKS